MPPTRKLLPLSPLILVVAVLAVAVAGLVAPAAVCNDAARLPPLRSGETVTGVAGQLMSNPLEEVFVYGYTTDSVSPDRVVVTARSWSCAPYARIEVRHDGSAFRLR